MQLRALNDIVIVAQEDNDLYGIDEKSKKAIEEGLIIIPEKNSIEKVSERGTVVKVGPNCKQAIKEGDNIIMTQFGGTNIMVNGTKYRFLKDSEILAVIE